MTSRELITREELLALVGISGRRNTQAWEAKGLPFSTKKGRSGGKASHLYEKRQALEWLRDHASAKISQRARQVLKEMDGGNPPEDGGKGEKKGSNPPPAPDRGGNSGSEGVGLEAAIRRMEAKEKRWSELGDRYLEAEDVTRAAMCDKQHIAMAKGLADLRSQYMEQERELGTLVNAADVAGLHLKVLTTLKNNILGVPNAMGPLVIPFLRNPEDAPAVVAAFEERLKDALRNTAAAGEGG